MVSQKAEAALLTPRSQGDFLLEVTLGLGKTMGFSPAKTGGQQSQRNSRCQGTGRWNYGMFREIQMVLRIKQPSERVTDESGKVDQAIS